VLLTAMLGYALGRVIVQPLDRLTGRCEKVRMRPRYRPRSYEGRRGRLPHQVFNDMVMRLHEPSGLERLSVTIAHGSRQPAPDDGALKTRCSARGGSSRVAVLLADVDYFKSYNDAHGHPAGTSAEASRESCAGDAMSIRWRVTAARSSSC
jgi:hypothetical protein